jgi:hypothetical protein
LSELLIQRIKPNKDILLSALVEANESIKNWYRQITWSAKKVL